MTENSAKASFANEDKAAQKDTKSKNRPIAEMNSISDLTFEKFIDSDLNKFTARIVGTEKRVFAAKVTHSSSNPLLSWK